MTVHYHHANRVERHRFETTGEGHHGGDKKLARDFLNILTGQAGTRAPLEAGLLSVEMCLAARDSCRTNSFKTLPVRDAVPVGSQ